MIFKRFVILQTSFTDIFIPIGEVKGMAKNNSNTMELDSILAEAKTLTTMDQAHEAVSRAAKVAGGKHSVLLPPVKDTTSYPETAPELGLLENGILHIVLPAHSGVKVSDSLYIHRVLDFLHGHLDAKGVVLDLRGNTGGHPYRRHDRQFRRGHTSVFPRLGQCPHIWDTYCRIRQCKHSKGPC